LYNKVRNHLTKKPYSTEKFKLNFENSTLLDGWDVNKEEANTSILFEKGGLYFLGIMNKQHNKVFRKTPKSNSSEAYRKVNYKLLPGASKMLPKVFFSAKNIAHYNPSDEILEIRNKGSHTKNGKPQEGYSKKDFSVEDCRKMIDFFKTSIDNHPEWKEFGFKFSPTQTYESIDGFYREVEAQGYNLTYTTIHFEFIDSLVNEGKLYLFQIYNKDFSPNSTGTPNLHTLYWKALFDEQNLKDVIFKLNGQAEIFYRKQSIQDKKKIVHKANEAIVNKNPLNQKTQSTFNYDIIKDKRFTVDKFQFHVPITINFKAQGTSNVNAAVNEYLQQHPNTYVIGLDRGERHLLYFSLINPKGEIEKQISLNEIVNQHNGNTYKTDYHKLLDKKEGDRLEARKDWGTIENIKELKEGYLSQVVHKIAELVVEYKAVVVMEDLNSGFKNSRIKVEKQVYQKFEKMLIDKFNFLAFKNPKEGQPGIYNAWQIANKFESFSKMGKQNGFIFYVPAWNTSKIDPVTGFVDFLKPKFESVEKSQKFLEKFDSIRFNKEKECFEFAFDYKKFTEKADGTQTKWSVIADNQVRYRWNKSLNQNKGSQEKILAAQTLEDLFGKNQIAYGSGENILNHITQQNSKDFFVELIRILQTVLALRHNNGLKDNNEEDKATAQQPNNADANGAYHIAKKGLWVLQQIKEAKDLKKVKTSISNKEWLNFVQA
jgi:CRISPR-associated protein Cpf1